MQEVVGNNLRRLRTGHGLTTEQLALACRQTGLNWSDSRVSAMENAKVACTLATLVAVTIALERASGEPIALADLLEHPDGFVTVNDHLSIRGPRLQQFVADSPVTIFSTDLRTISPDSAHDDSAFDSVRTLPDWAAVRDIAVPALQRSGAAEDRAARELGLTVAELAYQAARLWGRGFADERDARAGADSSPQKRGLVTRTLKAQLREAISA